jgi:hypothetical protein
MGSPTGKMESSTAQFLINHMLQTELVHLCAGPSGAGKTRWLLPTLQNVWRLGKPVLGHKSYPVPFCYVPMDRPYSSVEETLLTLNLDPLNMNIIPAMDLGLNKITQVLDRAEGTGAKLVVVEMFAYLLEGPETRESVRNFMGAAQRMLSGTGMTIIGTMESPKMRPKDIYRNPRQRISGPASWGHTAETIILIEPDPSKSETSSIRTIGIFPRNGQAESFEARFRPDGKLHIVRNLHKSGAGDCSNRQGGGFVTRTAKSHLNNHL